MEATAVVEIDLAALAGNYASLASIALPGACGAVVKANAYGLGVAPVARRLEAAGCRHFFVATPAEGVELRRVLARAEIFVLDGLAGSSREAFIAAGLTPVLNTRAELAAWGGAGPAAVHVDTGMSRLGLAAADIAALRQDTAAGVSAAAVSAAADAFDANAVDVRYVLTHLACADEPGHALNRTQIETFASLRALWPQAKTSIGNSAGLLGGDAFRSDLARPGIALYGANPFVDLPSPVEPVVRLRARVLQTRAIAAGQSIGYGASFIAPGAMRIAVVAIGYADGYLRSLSNRGIAVLAGQRVPIVGRVSMDLICLDITSLPPDAVAAGDFATLIGDGVSLEELATLAGTINYELLTALGTRLERVYINV